MNVKDVRHQLAAIEVDSGDAELAHGREDTLYWEVLASIANGTCEDPAAVAAEALKSKEIHFSRWCA